MKIRSAIITAAVLMFAASSLYAQNADSAASDSGNQNTQVLVKDFTLEENGWRITDYAPYISALKDLEKLQKQYSENVLRLAIDEYSTGMDILEDMDLEVAAIIERNKAKINLHEQWYWQEIDRKNQEYREIAYMKRESKTRAVTYLTKAINYADQVLNADLRNEPKFINFQAKLYQAYVATQYDIQNLKPCIPILERYVKLSADTRKDVWAYRYMASCYAFMENMLQRYKYTSDDELMQYKNKKNASLLVAAELLYGIESPEYKKMQETVQKDERRSERINSYR